MIKTEINLESAPFLEELYDSWMKDRSSVDPDWQEFFQYYERDAAGHRNGESVVLSADAEHAYKQARVNDLIWAYREVGHLYANTNPLGNYLMPGLKYLVKTIEGFYGSLSLRDFDLSEADLDTVFEVGPHVNPPRGTLREILAGLKETYCSTMGIELFHIQNRTMRGWLFDKIERNNNRPDWSKEQKQIIAKDLIRAEEFEHFLHSHYVGQKRFSLEGGEVLIPALHYLFDRAAAKAGIQEIVLGMAHRGRLTVLTAVLGKPLTEIFSVFEDNYKPHKYGGSGDEPYHIGFSTDHVNEDGSTIHVSLVPNPSHLEAVDPVVEGKARGAQRKRGDVHRKKVIPVLIHGDASITGQGIVGETFNMSQLKGYKTGGTIHILVNNQIGFTTASRDARSTFYATDIAKSMPIPIFHVNGHDPEQVVRAMDLALRFRHKFGYDVVVDIVCYRKYGHNEADEPSFTHPIMYNKIKNLPSVATVYCEKLAKEGSFTGEEQAAFRKAYHGEMEAALNESRENPVEYAADAFAKGEWAEMKRAYDHTPVETGVPEATLRLLGERVCAIPEYMHLNPKLQKIVETRLAGYREGKNIDWAAGEALAFASLLNEGFSVRLSGEDSSRGTFSQRHATWWNADTAEPMPYVPLNNLSDGQARFSVYDSPLSEFSVLGFEYGYSLTHPNRLILWEAQYGDFVNGAQVLIDNFIIAGESKWGRGSGLVMLLPHGYEGQGAEHSNAHMERFLDLCAEDNIQVCDATTPAQYFHLLRRQMKRSFRKPLIIMTPKGLLRHKLCVSELGEFAGGHFQEVLDDPAKLYDADTLVLCTGRVYYDFIQRREASAVKPAIVRLEQLYPFPEEQLREVLSRYKRVSSYIWLQEEGRNRGAWTFVNDRISSVLGEKRLRYVGRPASAAPASASHRKHLAEIDAFMGELFAPAAAVVGAR